MTNPTQSYSSPNPINPDSLVNTYNKSTPNFYGGASLDFSPTDKLSLFFTAYYYSNQTIMTNKVDVTNDRDNKSYFAGGVGVPDMYKVKAKIIPTVKVSYKFWKDNYIYLNARNLFGSTNKEFAYTDRIGATYMLGVNFNF